MTFQLHTVAYTVVDQAATAAYGSGIAVVRCSPSMMAYERRNWDVTSVTDVADVASRRVRRPEWVAHVLDEVAEPPRAVLLHLPSGRRIGLSDTATRVWLEVVASGADGCHLAAITEILAPEYGVDPSIIDHDVAALLADMVEGEWLEVVPDTAGSDGHDEGEGGGRR